MKIGIMEITNSKPLQNKKVVEGKDLKSSNSEQEKTFDDVLRKAEKEKEAHSKDVRTIDKKDLINEAEDNNCELKDLNLDEKTLMDLIVLINQNLNNSEINIDKFDDFIVDLDSKMIEVSKGIEDFDTKIKPENSNDLGVGLKEVVEIDKSTEVLNSIKNLLLNNDESVDIFELKNFLGNIVDKANKTEDVSIEVSQKIVESPNIDDLKELKNKIIEVLNTKGISNEEIKSLNLKTENLDFKNSDALKNDLKSNTEVVDIINDEKIMSNEGMKEFSSDDKSQLSEGQNSKEDKLLSKILSSDETKTSFDINMQRLKEFSPIENKNDSIVVNKSSIDLDVKNVIKNMSINNNKELIVKVNPGNLGEIAIKLISDGDQMKALIKVSSKETFALINSQDIKNLLSNESIKISDVDISLYEDTTFFEEQNKFKGNQEENEYKQNSKNEFIDLEEMEMEEETLSNLDIIV